jgi:hypothetical protein
MNIKDLFELMNLPHIEINLQLEKTAGNDPFFETAVRRFYRDAWTPHPKLLYFGRKYQYGFAACPVPAAFDDYFRRLDSSARRNHRKAVREGYVFKRLDYNAHLEDVREIWQSAPVRQGIMPLEFREGKVRPITDPPSSSMYQDYPYFGVFKDGKLVCYAGCLISGDLCSLNDIFGHDKYLEAGVVPFAIIEIMRMVMVSYPSVKYYGYGTYFGASESMRRFKRKLLFLPHRVTWRLQTPAPAYALSELGADEAMPVSYSKR